MLNLYKKMFISFLCLISTSSIQLPREMTNIPHGQQFSYGIASWYGPGFHGRTTANGEIFNKDGLTAAHKALPFNTKVLVTNLKNNKSVAVRINDRGPFIENRIIDLSEEAARIIDSKVQGIAYIKLQILAPSTILR